MKSEKNLMIKGILLQLAVAIVLSSCSSEDPLSDTLPEEEGMEIFTDPDSGAEVGTFNRTEETVTLDMVRWYLIRRENAHGTFRARILRKSDGTVIASTSPQNVSRIRKEETFQCTPGTYGLWYWRIDRQVTIGETYEIEISFSERSTGVDEAVAWLYTPGNQYPGGCPSDHALCGFDYAFQTLNRIGDEPRFSDQRNNSVRPGVNYCPRTINDNLFLTVSQEFTVGF